MQNTVALYASPAEQRPAHTPDYALEKDAWWRMMSLTMAILKQTQSQLEKTEARLETLEFETRQDDLTGLRNRRGFYESLSRELDRANRELSRGGLLVMIDLDNFKYINDTHGHAAGDAALRLIGQTLARTVRTMDTAARLGGDEFVLLLADADPEQALQRIQTLATHINGLSFNWNGHDIKVRASFGLKIYSAGDHADTIMQAADNALYADKKRGKKQQTGPTFDAPERMFAIASPV